MDSAANIPVSLESQWDTPLYTLQAVVESMTVGSLIAVVQSERVVQVSDLKVEKDIIMPGKRPRVVPRWLQPKSKAESFRGRGIGSMMLEHFFGWCREMKLSEAYGSIVQQDVNEASWLLAWYGRHGFQVSEPDDRCLRHAVHLVVWKNV